MTPQPTDRELECLRAYLQAGSVRGAADRLGIRESTAKFHLANVRSKLGARTIAEAVFRLYDQLAA